MDKKILQIQDYGYFGEGIAKDNGKVCFVPYSLKDEIVEAYIVQDNAKLSKCRLDKVVKPSPLREVPPCPYFGQCGGCAFQHTSYANELEIKKNMLISQFKKVGFADEIEIISSPNEYNYRNKIKLFCKDNNLALFEVNSKRLVPIERCLLVKESIQKAMESIQTFVRTKDLGKFIENIYIESLGENTIVLFKFYRNIKVDFTGLQIMLGAKCGIYASFANKKEQHITGIKYFNVEEFGLKCQYEMSSFHQVNNEIANLLYQDAVNSVVGNKVINGYSGGGVLSGILAQKGFTVYGIELGKAEHESAQRLKKINNLNRLFNIQGDCAIKIGELISSDMKTIIVDPPRAGCDKRVCQAINDSNLQKVIYISCDSSTLVRDIARLSNFQIEKVTAFDMFPRTSSIEVLCILKRKTV